MNTNTLRCMFLISVIINMFVCNNIYSSDLDNNGIQDHYEQKLANKFCPCLQLHADDQGVSPEPVEIVGTTDWHNNLYGRVWNILGELVPPYEYKSIKIFYRNNGVGVLSSGYWWISGITDYDNINNSINYSWSVGTYYIGWHYDWGGPNANNPDLWHSAYSDERQNNNFNDRIYANLWEHENTYVVQYWFFYPFNDAANKHEGDWEHINVHISSQVPSEAEIVKIDYYIHNSVIPDLSQENTDFFVVDETHPVVFVGGYSRCGGTAGDGSHASYPCLGRWPDIESWLDTDEDVHGDGRFIHYKGIDVFLLPHDVDVINYNTIPEMSWLKANIRWGHMEVEQWGDWVEYLPFWNPDVGNNAPVGPRYNAADEEHPRGAWFNTRTVNGQCSHYDNWCQHYPVTNSGWSPPSVQTPPSPPVLESFVRAGSQATLTWTNPSGNQGTKIYYSTSPRFDRFYTYQGTGLSEGNSPITICNPSQTSVTLHNLGTACYFFALRSYNSNGESWFSNELSEPPTTSGTLTHDEVWTGNHSLTGNVTVPSGITLTISDASINLNGYYLKSTGGTILKEGNVSFSPKDICAKSGSSIKGQYSTVASALSEASSGQIVYLSEDTYTESNNLTVNSNVSLQMNSGVTFKMASGKKLTINGKLKLSWSQGQSKITFKASGSSWYGIDFTSSCNWYSLNGGIFKNMTNGLVFNNCDMNIEYCEFEDNTIGINIKNYSYVYLEHSRVENFNATGIKCQQNGALFAYPYNVIYENSTGVWGDNTCWMKLGYSPDQKGMNSIINFNWDINSSYPSSIYARYNWWGTDNYPSPMVTNNVVWEPYLDYDPNGVWLAKKSTPTSPMVSNENPSTSSSPGDSVGLKELELALELFSSEDYDQALNNFQTLVTKYPEHFVGQQALVFVNRSFKQLNRTAEALPYLEQKATAYEGTNLAGTANAIRVGHLVRESNYQKAIELAAGITQNYPRSELAKYALYDLGTIYWYFLEDHKTGEKYYRQLIAQYPEDDLSISALVTLGEWDPDSRKQPKPRREDLADAQAVKKFALLQNYPNPFNPSTTISYQLPEEGHVSLKIYNILGEEVAALVNTVKPAGSYSINWNGQDRNGNVITNGVYWIRMQAGQFVAQRKLVVLR